MTRAFLHCGMNVINQWESTRVIALQAVGTRSGALPLLPDARPAPD